MLAPPLPPSQIIVIKTYAPPRCQNQAKIEIPIRKSYQRTLQEYFKKSI
jgi:hypothetical protein